ncbi:MAG: YmdB family metallophosphoesterase [Alphaproteobacteria bacterium]|nr:YmdB family metallophosphoesterase [Alphaproteobacteria bacterium]
MRALYLGDIVGRRAREAVQAALPDLRRTLALDFVVLNGENAAGGFGITGEIAEALFAAGADCIVTGNHVWDQREIIPYFQRETRLLRPLNFPASAPGRGLGRFELPDGRRAIVLQAMGRVFMEPLDDPFAAADQALADLTLGRDAAFILADIHAEATSEKMAFGHHLDGRVSAVVGTHSHVPTADLRFLPGGTAYQTDIGMCGDYDSVIGMDKAEALQRFRHKVPGGRMSPALGEPTLCGTLFETDDATGLCRQARAFRQGGCLPAG